MKNNKDIYVNGIPISARANIARRMTEKSANVKDWRLNRRGRVLKAIANDIMNDRGYVIGTVSEIVGRFGKNVFKVVPVDDGNRHIWGIIATIPDRNGRVELDFFVA